MLQKLLRSLVWLDRCQQPDKVGGTAAGASSNALTHASIFIPLLAESRCLPLAPRAGKTDRKRLEFLPLMMYSVYGAVSNIYLLKCMYSHVFEDDREVIQPI